MNLVHCNSPLNDVSLSRLSACLRMAVRFQDVLFYHTLMRSKFVFVAWFGFTLFGADARWIRLRSANFEMYTTASERSARETLKYFEQVRSFFQQGMGSIPGKSLPVRIVAFNSRKEYEPYRLNNFATAFYHPTERSDDIVLS